MKFGIHFSYWADEWATLYEPYIKRAAALGFDLLEISCSGLMRFYQDADRLGALKRCADETGLALCAGYGPSPTQNLCSDDEAVVNSGIEFYRRIMPMLEALHIRTLGGPLYAGVRFAPNVPREAVRERFVRNLQRVLPLAGDVGVTLCLEVVNRYESHLVNTAEEVCGIVDAVGSPQVRVMLDTFHMNIEEDDMSRAVLATANRLGHVHVSEQNRRLPGQGHLAWKSFFDALHAIGYKGNVVIEAFVRKGGSVGDKVMLWRDLSPLESLDSDASDAVSFLKAQASEGFSHPHG